MSLSEELKTAVKERVENFNDESLWKVKGQFDIYCDEWKNSDPKVLYSRQALVEECDRRGLLK